MTSLFTVSFKKQLSIVKALKMILILVSIQGKKEEEMVDTSKTEQGQLIVLHIASA